MAAPLPPAGGGEGRCVARVRDSFAAFFAAMHDGTMAEWADAWLAPDCHYVMHHPDTGVQQTRSREEYCRHYNTVVRDYWGGCGSSVTYRPQSFAAVCPSRVRATFLLDVVRPHHHGDGDGDGGGGGAPPVLPDAAGYRRGIVWDVTLCAAGERIRGWELWVETLHQTGGGTAWAARGAEGTAAAAVGAAVAAALSAAAAGAVCAPPVAAAASAGAGCGHNDWDSLRAKRGWAVVRCRRCARKCRVAMPGEWRRRCAGFLGPGGCAAGAACALLHVHPPPPRNRAAGAAAAECASGRVAGSGPC